MRFFIFMFFVYLNAYSVADQLDKDIVELLNRPYVAGTYGKLTDAETEARLKEARTNPGFKRDSYRFAVLYSANGGLSCRIQPDRIREHPSVVEACGFLGFMNILVNSGVYPKEMVSNFTKNEYWAYRRFVSERFAQ